jgi:hypothetical protein
MIRAVLIATAIGIGLSIAAPASAAGSAVSADAGGIVGGLTARTASIAGYSADLSLHIALHSFPFISLSVAGSTTYQQPGRYTVEMHTLPAIARALHSVSGDAGDPTVWQHKYDIVVDRGAVAAPGSVALRMTQRIHGQIDHVEAFVDVASMTVSRMEWYYASGGHIFVDDHYAMVGSVLMLDHQCAEIDMPGVRATATSDISNYSIQSEELAANR